MLVNPVGSVVEEHASDIETMKVDELRTAIKELRKISSWFQHECQMPTEAINAVTDDI